MSLMQDIKNLDALIKSLQEKREQLIKKLPCKYGEYTNAAFNTHGCKTCGAPNTVICSNTNVIGKRRNGNLCNPQKCKYFKHPDLT